MLPKKTVYLAGAINGQPDSVVYDWRNQAAELMLHSSCLQPVMPPGLAPNKTDRQIVLEDLRALASCDAVLLNATVPSFGTGVELVSAWTKGQPIVVYSETKPVKSAFVREMASRIFFDLAEAVRFLDGQLRPDAPARGDRREGAAGAR